MDTPDTGPELLVAALLYLVTAHSRTQCSGLATCIARHFTSLARHPEAHRLIREVAAAYAHEWEATARESTGAPCQRVAMPDAALH